ncbi:hypothetical protein HK105_205904 [Polyrhizophydium stewartii]|uniref:Uncharacterized protein n=1 Tax=Polyrhizophydium stewartii TaxID=2732419 RepID=A0ABR4N4W6_9FUNG|nr:hypothetical protein HK105_003084 [Polyrhizophydium stewartii]
MGKPPRPPKVLVSAFSHTSPEDAPPCPAAAPMPRLPKALRDPRSAPIAAAAAEAAAAAAASGNHAAPSAELSQPPSSSSGMPMLQSELVSGKARLRAISLQRTPSGTPVSRQKPQQIVTTNDLVHAALRRKFGGASPCQDEHDADDGFDGAAAAP